MTYPASIALGLLAAAAPPPRPAVPPVPAEVAVRFGTDVAELAAGVSAHHPRKPAVRELVRAAVRGLYAAAGEPEPPEQPDRGASGDSAAAQQAVLTAARLALGDRPTLAGPRAYIAADDALARAADPYSALTARGPGQPGGADEEFALGLELEGTAGRDWLAFVAERAAGERNLRSPLPLPWRVSRVLPGSPAAAAGLRPGDRVTAVAGRPVTAATAAGLLGNLLAARQRLHGPDGDGSPPPPHVLTVVRDGRAEPFAVSVAPTGYTPESVFGYRRETDGRWDYFPDRKGKIAYIRLGYVESDGAPEAFRAALDAVTGEGATGLILDLRWCPGGYVSPTVQVAAMLLKPGQPVAIQRDGIGSRPLVPQLVGWEPGAWDGLPIGVLVGPETAGGGEMIAAALQDYRRATVIGQRTFGRASVSQVAGDAKTPIRVPGLMLRLTTGYTDRPTGKPRHRQPDHGPRDEWGVRPDPGCEVPTTPDLSRRLRAWADGQALRRPGEADVRPLDDPLDDPQRAVAERILRARINGR
jgi:hypothetical protein